MTIARIVTLATLFAGVSNTVSAQTANQTVTFQVDAINQIAFSGSPSLVINTAVAGSEPTSATNSTAAWAVTTNQSGAKITASLNALMPAGLTLSVNLAAPAAATAVGPQPLTTIAVDLVTGLTRLAASALGVTYQLDATSATGVVASSSRIVTYTITGGT